MVAKKVEIRTLGYQKDSVGAHWSCDGSTSYELSEIEKTDRGTEIVLSLEDDELEFLEPVRVRGVLTRYCNFLPVAIYLEGEVVNDQNLLLTRMAIEFSEEEYRDFYFPKLTNEFDVTKSHIKLFCKQVFVSDNCAELIPEFLTPPPRLSRCSRPAAERIAQLSAERTAGSQDPRRYRKPCCWQDG